MEHILAALIIACSNSVQPGMTGQQMKLRRECFERVTMCAASFELKNKKINLIQFAHKCGQDVY